MLLAAAVTTLRIGLLACLLASLPVLMDATVPAGLVRCLSLSLSAVNAHLPLFLSLSSFLSTSLSVFVSVYLSVSFSVSVGSLMTRHPSMMPPHRCRRAWLAIKETETIVGIDTITYMYNI